jgi:hypothetical protein
MQNNDVAMYINLMEEIKRRIVVVNTLLLDKSALPYKATKIESFYLQIRKVLELVAFGSLVANREAYSKIYTEFSKAWNARVLFRELDRVNPEFYPRALQATPGLSPDVKVHYIDRIGALTKEEFIKLYEKSGAIMHAENPYGSKTDYEYYDRLGAEWRDKILWLLDTHSFHLVGSPRRFVVEMGAFNTPVRLLTACPK